MPVMTPEQFQAEVQRQQEITKSIGTAAPANPTKYISPSSGGSSSGGSSHSSPAPVSKPSAPAKTAAPQAPAKPTVEYKPIKSMTPEQAAKEGYTYSGTVGWHRTPATKKNIALAQQDAQRQKESLSRMKKEIVSSPGASVWMHQGREINKHEAAKILSRQQAEVKAHEDYLRGLENFRQTKVDTTHTASTTKNPVIASESIQHSSEAELKKVYERAKPHQKALLHASTIFSTKGYRYLGAIVTRGASTKDIVLQRMALAEQQGGGAGAMAQHAFGNPVTMYASLTPIGKGLVFGAGQVGRVLGAQAAKGLVVGTGIGAAGVAGAHIIETAKTDPLQAKGEVITLAAGGAGAVKSFGRVALSKASRFVKTTESATIGKVVARNLQTGKTMQKGVTVSKTTGLTGTTETAAVHQTVTTSMPKGQSVMTSYGPVKGAAIETGKIVVIKKSWPQSVKDALPKVRKDSVFVEKPMSVKEVAKMFEGSGGIIQQSTTGQIRYSMSRAGYKLPKGQTWTDVQGFYIKKGTVAPSGKGVFTRDLIVINTDAPKSSLISTLKGDRSYGKGLPISQKNILKHELIHKYTGIGSETQGTNLQAILAREKMPHISDPMGKPLAHVNVKQKVVLFTEKSMPKASKPVKYGAVITETKPTKLTLVAKSFTRQPGVSAGRFVIQTPKHTIKGAVASKRLTHVNADVHVSKSFFVAEGKRTGAGISKLIDLKSIKPPATGVTRTILKQPTKPPAQSVAPALHKSLTGAAKTTAKAPTAAELAVPAMGAGQFAMQSPYGTSYFAVSSPITSPQKTIAQPKDTRTDISPVNIGVTTRDSQKVAILPVSPVRAPQAKIPDKAAGRIKTPAIQTQEPVSSLQDMYPPVTTTIPVWFEKSVTSQDVVPVNIQILRPKSALEMFSPQKPIQAIHTVIQRPVPIVPPFEPPPIKRKTPIVPLVPLRGTPKSAPGLRDRKRFELSGRKRKKDINPLADLLSVTQAEAKHFGTKARHQAITPTVKKAFSKQFHRKSFGMRFPVA